MQIELRELSDIRPYCDVIVQRWEQFAGRKADRVPANEETQT